MNEIAAKGKRRFLFVSFFSNVLFLIYDIIIYRKGIFLNFEDILFAYITTLILFVLIYFGYKWVIYFFRIILSIGILGFIFWGRQNYLKISVTYYVLTLLVMINFGYLIYFFSTNEFKAFFDHQKTHKFFL